VAAGERKDLDRGERDGHIEGACLTERSMGTSGVRLALATRHPVLVHGAEHYAPALHDLACAAAPVYDPRDGRLLAVLNLTAPHRRAWQTSHCSGTLMRSPGKCNGS
jgi:transcriptional regulator of acetoin/glycerol metabolism